MLERAVASGQVRHAYLFHGPARVGKATLARWLAMRLNCQRPAAPCGQCRPCRLIANGAHPDVRSLQLPGERDPIGLPLEASERSGRSAERVIGIEQVRALQHDASLAANEAPWKVYLLVDAENLSLPAANCLLKTLEEPPPGVVVIVTVGDPLDLLPTLVSRCQLVRLGPVPVAEIAAHLHAERNLPTETADLLARLSAGRPGWAIEAAGDPELLASRDRQLDDLTRTTSRSYRERLSVAEKLASVYSRDPGEALQTLSVWQVWWWDVYLLQQQCPELVTNVDRREALAATARAASPEAVRSYLRALSEAAARLLQNVNPRLVLEALLLTSPVQG